MLFIALLLATAPAAASVEMLDLGDLSKPSLSQLRVDSWQTEQGLPLNTVQSVYQTRAGHLWVGTAGGLARFDGVRFTTFDVPDMPELTARPIFGFHEDAAGTLWIGNHTGVLRYRDGKFERLFGAEVTERRRVWSFAEAADGVMWMASENGLVRWKPGKEGKPDIKVYKVADGLPTIRLRSLTFDKAGTLWIATSGGGLVSFANDKFSVLDTKNGFPNQEVRQVIADPKGGVWAATAGGGLAQITEGRIKVFTVKDGLPTDQLTALAWGKQGELWIGTWGAGVTRMRDGQFSTLSSAGGLAGDQIWSLHVDTEGSVWVGTWVGGLNRLRSRAFFLFGKPEGLIHDNIRSILHARDGVIWVSMSGGGVNRIEAGRITAIGKAEGLPTLEASSLYEDRDGAIWMGTYTEGAARWRKGRIERFGTAQGLPSPDIRTFFQDKSGTLWAGTKSGVARFNGKTFEAVKEAGAPTEGVAAILQARDGALWFGTTGNGLVRYADGAFTTLTRKEGLVSNWIVALHEDETGGLWIGSVGEGLNRYKNGKMTAIRPADGLWDGVVQTLIEDRSGQFWITCNRGFYRVSRADLDAFADGKIPRFTSTGYGPGDALRSTTFAGGLQPAGAVDKLGHVWLPSYNGLVIVDPARLPGAGEPPAVEVEEVILNNQAMPPGTSVELPPGSVPLTLRYFAATLRDADRVQFRYRMDGLTRDWVVAGRNREASFPSLPHGRYQFRVAASLDGRRWSEAEKVLPVVVKPHFHQTPWFIALCLVLALLTVVGLSRLRTRQLHKQHVAMEKLVAEKTEALRQANEHLSRLSFADALTGLANRRCMDETLETEWRRAERTQTPLAVVMADIDFFKAYNDSLGHPEGDKCLVRVAEIIRGCMTRAGDLAARYGGEEFMILLPGVGEAAARILAEELRQACLAAAIPHPASSASSLVTISLGVAACMPSVGGTVATLVAKADAALYRAKQEGRNRVC